MYDYISRGPDGLGILIADVAGHGIPAALIASMVKMAFSLQTGRLADTSGMLASLNGALLEKCDYQFVTAGYAYIDAAARSLHYSRAGHLPALVVRARDATVAALSPQGKLLALFEDISIQSARIDLEPGDLVFLCTDGLVECCNPSGEPFGMERLAGALGENAGKGPEALVGYLVELIREWRGDAEFEDDVTMVAAGIE
jgi:serine phosphatase RsbU (regulator of sigma subunit)